MCRGIQKSLAIDDVQQGCNVFLSVVVFGYRIQTITTYH